MKPNPTTGELDLVGMTSTEALAYLKLDQTTAQTVTASPVLNWMTASKMLLLNSNKKLVSMNVAAPFLLDTAPGFESLGLNYSATNLQLSGGGIILNTIQDIATTSSPTFANLTLGNNGIISPAFSIPSAGGDATYKAGGSILGNGGVGYFLGGHSSTQNGGSVYLTGGTAGIGKTEGHTYIGRSGATNIGSVYIQSFNGFLKATNGLISADTNTYALASALSGYLPLTGGTLTGHLLFTDNTYDIGASGATRPRDLWLGGNASITGTVQGGKFRLNQSAFTSNEVFAGSLDGLVPALGLTTTTDNFILSNSGNSAMRFITASSASTLRRSSLKFSRARGTTAAPAIVVDTDDLGWVNFEGYDGSSMRVGSAVRAAVDGTPVAGKVPGNLTFWTTEDGVGTLTTRWTIDDAGHLLSGTDGTGAYDIKTAGDISLAGKLTNVMGATDVTGIDISNTAYTGTADLKAIKAILTTDTGNITGGSYWGAQISIVNNKTITASQPQTVAAIFGATSSQTFNGAAAVSSMTQGLSLAAMSAVTDATTKDNSCSLYGAEMQAITYPFVNKASGTNTYAAYGVGMRATYAEDYATAGNAIVTNQAADFTALADLYGLMTYDSFVNIGAIFTAYDNQWTGTTVNYGAIFTAGGGAANWAIYVADLAYDGTGEGQVYLGGDSQKTYWGADLDMEAYHDGTNAYLKANTGYVVLGSTKATTGDPSGVEGMIYINTNDNKIRMYADGAWRDLATW